MSLRPFEDDDEGGLDIPEYRCGLGSCLGFLVIFLGGWIIAGGIAWVILFFSGVGWNG